MRTSFFPSFLVLLLLLLQENQACILTPGEIVLAEKKLSIQKAFFECMEEKGKQLEDDSFDSVFNETSLTLTLPESCEQDSEKKERLKKDL